MIHNYSYMIHNYSYMIHNLKRIILRKRFMDINLIYISAGKQYIYLIYCYVKVY